MYTVRDANDNNNDDFTDTIIKKGTKLKLDFLCNDPSCVLKWVRDCLSSPYIKLNLWSVFIADGNSEHSTMTYDLE